MNKALQTVKNFDCIRCIPENHISFLENLTKRQKSIILERKPQSIYVEDDTYEIDRYNEVHFYLNNGEFLQNAVAQDYVTKTVQGSFTKEGETISQAIMRLGIRSMIELIILFSYDYRENNGKILMDSNNVSIINWGN